MTRVRKVLDAVAWGVAIVLTALGPRGVLMAIVGTVIMVTYPWLTTFLAGP